MKKIVGVLLLVGAFGLGTYAKMQHADDEKQARLYMRMAAEAREREQEIMLLKNKLAMDALTVGDAIVKHGDAKAARAAQAEDSARLGSLEEAQKMLGTAAMNEDGAMDVGRHHWVILGEFVGAGLLGLFGVLALV